MRDRVMSIIRSITLYFPTNIFLVKLVCNVVGNISLVGLLDITAIV